MSSTESQMDPAPGQPRYAELAQRLIVERADLFRVTATAQQRRVVEVAAPRAAGAPAGGRRRRGQLTLPLRPRVLDGGDTVSG